MILSRRFSDADRLIIELVQGWRAHDESSRSSGNRERIEDKYLLPVIRAYDAY
jgi:hypothetical protein